MQLFVIKDSDSKYKLQVSILLCENDYLNVMGHFLSSDVSPIELLICMRL